MIIYEIIQNIIHFVIILIHNDLFLCIFIIYKLILINMSNRKPKSISFKPVDKGKPCDVIINGDLEVKKNVFAQCDVTVKKCLKVKNIVYNSETIDESGETLSNDKTLSWINTAGTGVLNDTTKEGFYKKVVKITEDIINWQSIKTNNDNIDNNVNVIAIDSKENIYIGGIFTQVDSNTNLNGLAKWDVNAQSWTSVNGVNDFVQFGSRGIRDIAIDSKDNVYIGGEITSVDNNTDLNALAKWNGSSWTSVNGIGDGIDAVVDPYVNTIDFDKNNENTIYIGGFFSEVTGNNNLFDLAKWDDDNKSWTSINGVDDDVKGEVSSLSLDSNNNLYIAGTFSQVNSDTILNKLAKWDNLNSSWTSVNGINDNIIVNFIISIVIDPSDNIYIGGDFTEVDNNISLVNLAKWDNDNKSWTPVNGVNDNINSVVRTISLDLNNNLYIGGLFSSVDSNSNLTFFAKWDGSNWTSLKSDGDNINSSIFSIDVDSKNNVYIGGQFTSVDSNSNLQRLAKYQQNTYELFFNSNSSVELNNKGDNACFIYNEFLNEWIKL